MAGFGGSIKLTGETEYKRALTGITQSLKETSSELKAVSTSFDKNDKSTTALASKSQVLNKQLDQQKARLQLMQTEYDRLSESEDENTVAMSKLRTQMNQAQADINKTAKEIDNLGKETDDTTEKTKKGSEGWTVYKQILADLGTKAITSALNGLKSLGSSLINVGKQALDSYADYEQLVGGVETLFKDSAPIVQQYANDAYKNAGMSANQYMETVTSFSASLLQSLGGDTEDAANYAQDAIIDMADNANKMGTDISMIQNAYQGFAKQNYTMLDNLKLGYGGTKTEMQRLIDDANKVKAANGEMADLSIDSFADITEAIHIIQTEMGITGTTAKEASSTISGSVNSMKSAWSNMLTGIADDNADFEGLVNNLVDSIGTALENILPRVKVIIQGLFKLITTLIPKLLPELLKMINEMLPQIIKSITDALPLVAQTVGEVIPLIVQTIVDMLPQLLECGIQIIVALVEGLANSLPQLIPTIINAVLLMVKTLIDNIDLLIDAGMKLLIGVAKGLIEALPQLIEKIPEIIDSLVNALIDNVPLLIETGITLIVELTKGLIKAIPQLVAAIPKIITSLINGFKSYLSKLYNLGGDLLKEVGEGIKSGLSKITDIGKNMVKGLWNGIKEMKEWVIEKVKSFGKSILNGIKKVLGIHSPSTIFRDEVGKNMALGLGEGFTDEMGNVTKEMQDAIPTNFDATVNANAGESMINTFDSMVSAFKEALSEMKIEMDDEEMGKFVDKTVARTIYT